MYNMHWYIYLGIMLNDFVARKLTDFFPYFFFNSSFIQGKNRIQISSETDTKHSSIYAMEKSCIFCSQKGFLYTDWHKIIIID